MNADAAEPRRRLFVAVEVPDRVKLAIDAAATPLQRRAADAKWASPAQWHLTLAFLGWVDAGRQAAVEQACAAATQGMAPFELQLGGVAGMFGGRVLWAGLEDAPGLEALALRVREEVAAAGFEIEERPFRAHLTLARARRGGSLPRGLADEYAGPTAQWTVDRLVLMRSRLQRTGARYSTEAAWRLQP